MVCN
ncbi:hypothetical protein VCHC69A1_3170A, partial [Vibrio cholerae HC-69A1]